MQQITKEKVTQIEALRIIDDKMGKVYADFMASSPQAVYSKYRTKVVEFKISFIVKEGSVMARVFFEEVKKLK